MDDTVFTTFNEPPSVVPQSVFYLWNLSLQLGAHCLFFLLADGETIIHTLELRLAVVDNLIGGGGEGC